jgi:hypothetical protein
MLAGITDRLVSDELHRLANRNNTVEFLIRQGFDSESIREQVEFLKEFGLEHGAEELLDAPFRPKQALNPKRIGRTRYSDGTLTAFYGALEAATAQTEVKYHYVRLALGDPAKRRTAYYSHFTCQFSGRIKDLRGKEQSWPLLVEKDCAIAYPFCNRVGEDAVSRGLDGLYVPSAREMGGTCAPVFQRRALSHPQEQALIALSYRADSTDVEAETVAVNPG